MARTAWLVALVAAATPVIATAQTQVELDMKRLPLDRVIHEVIVQGRSMGSQVTTTQREGKGFRFTDEVDIKPMMTQKSVITTDGRGAVTRVNQTGVAQGQPTRIELKFSDDRVKGESTTRARDGMVSVKIDSAIVKGAFDDNSVALLVAAVPLVAGGKWTIPVVASANGSSSQATLEVTGTESVTVPAGTFDVFVADFTDRGQVVKYYVTTKAPFRVVQKIAGGGVFKIVLAKVEKVEVAEKAPIRAAVPPPHH